LKVKLQKDPKDLISTFRSLKSVQDLSNLLEVDQKFLRFVVQVQHTYTEFQLPKRSGGTRPIAIPSKNLAILQRKLASILSFVYSGRHVVHGFCLNRSIKTNALTHHGRKYICGLDLKEFFPSIHFGRVRGLFRASPYQLPDGVALMLAKICCHKGYLPQGAPTSPILSNLVCAALDSRLRDFARLHGCRYTRYADDITFSSNSPFPSSVIYLDMTVSPARWQVGIELEKIFKSHQFEINGNKTRMLPPSTRQEVTGVLINSRLNVSRAYVRKTRAMLHALEKYGHDASLVEYLKSAHKKNRFEDPSDFFSIVRGRIEHLGYIRGRDDALYLTILRRYQALKPDQKYRTIDVSSACQLDVLEEAVWLLESEEVDATGQTKSVQATAFSLVGVGIVTAYHALLKDIFLSQPHLKGGKVYPAKIQTVLSEADVAILNLEGAKPFVRLIPAAAPCKEIGSLVRIVGFPNHHVDDTIHVGQATITQRRKVNGFEHCLVNGDTIVIGNSGGPVLDGKNHVCGIALRGWGENNDPDDVSRSSFLPVGTLLKLMIGAHSATSTSSVTVP
jgi:RNA-directed DNA polymerase